MQPLFRLVGLGVQFIDVSGTAIHAVNGASLDVLPGEVLGVLGESGSGKTTLAKALLRLLPANAHVTSETFELAGRDLLKIGEKQFRALRGAHIAIIPQDPSQALNPVMRVGDQIAEVFRAHRDWSPKRCQQEADLVLARVHLTDTARRMYDAYPHQLSGGQRQRVVIAQAICCQPAMVIADEPTASLDSASECEILELFRELKRDNKMSLLFITHDPRLLVGLAERVAVVYAGRVVEIGPLTKVFGEPAHPYTRALLACLGRECEFLSPASGGRFPTIEGTSPDAASIPRGCSFAPRCSRRLETCNHHQPSAVELEDDRRVECLLYGR